MGLAGSCGRGAAGGSLGSIWMGRDCLPARAPVGMVEHGASTLTAATDVIVGVCSQTRLVDHGLGECLAWCSAIDRAAAPARPCGPCFAHGWAGPVLWYPVLCTRRRSNQLLIYFYGLLSGLRVLAEVGGWQPGSLADLIQCDWVSACARGEILIVHFETPSSFSHVAPGQGPVPRGRGTAGRYPKTSLRYRSPFCLSIHCSASSADASGWPSR